MRWTVLATLSLVSCAHPGPPAPDPTIELPAGDYELLAEADSGARAGRRERGTLSLRPFGAVDPSLDRQHGLYGWTDVDFGRLGAPVGRTGTPADSRDPENPGVLVFVPPRDLDGSGLPGRPILLIGTNDNNQRTRGDLDGGGIGLFARNRRGACIAGPWSEWGVAVGGRGRFTACLQSPGSPAPTVSAPGPAAPARTASGPP
jgi:hypothetical protein